MKKTTKIFSTIALSAALAMSAIPAFAAPTAPKVELSETSVEGTDGSAATTINVQTYVDQISVALPLTMPVYANVGGGEGVSPTNYYIENDSRANIKVDKVEWKIMEDQQPNWSFAKDGEAVANAKPNSGATVAYGSLAFTLTPKAEGETSTIGTKTYTQEGSGSELNIWGTTAKPFEGNSSDCDWKIKPYSGTGSDIEAGKGSKLLLDVKTMSSALSGTLGEANVDVAKLIYTVGVDGVTTTPGA